MRHSSVARLGPHNRHVTRKGGVSQAPTPTPPVLKELEATNGGWELEE